MILPNNKTKKYVKMVMGIYLLFNIISPIIKNKEVFNINQFDINNYKDQYTSADLESNIDQTSMDKRLKEIYIDELEKDITTKLESKGYIVNSCNVDATLSEDEENADITKIVLDIEETKDDVNNTSNNQTENSNIEQNNESSQNKETIENRIVDEIQKIKKVEIGDKSSNNELEAGENEKEEYKNSEKLSNTSKIQVKNFLIEEYGVSEKCLKIN